MQYLKDYLCARSAGLLVSSFHSRVQIVDQAPDWHWGDDCIIDKGKTLRWHGTIQPIHEGGLPYGATIAVFHSARTSVDPEDDVPIFPHPSEDSFESSSWEKTSSGKKLFRIVGEMWRNQWIPPASSSPCVRRDHVESDVEFIVKSSGERKSGPSLESHRGWLWFKPSIVQEMLSRRAGFLKWYTEDTGALGTSSKYSVHFGINGKGFLNVLAKDIARLPPLHQRIWISHNVLPDGGISKELLMSQMRSEPAKSCAPEILFKKALQHIRKVSQQFIGRSLLKKHREENIILRNVHRFQGHSLLGLCTLAKDLTKLAVEQLDNEFLKQCAPSNDEKLGSIKRLEKYLTSLGFGGRNVTAPLVGVCELRQRDAHLPSRELKDSFELLSIKDDGNYIRMAKQMIYQVAQSIAAIGDMILNTHGQKI